MNAFDKYFWVGLVLSLIGGFTAPNILFAAVWGIICLALTIIARENRWLD